MRISRKTQRYGFIAAAAVTGVSALLYANARSSLTALGNAGEGTAEEIASAVGAERFWLVMVLVATGVTVFVISLATSDDVREDG